MAYITSCFCTGVIAGLWYDSIALAPAVIAPIFIGNWFAFAAAWAGGACGRMIAAAIGTKALVRMGRNAHLIDTCSTTCLSVALCGGCFLPIFLPRVWMGAVSFACVSVLQLISAWYARHEHSAYEHFFRSRKKVHRQFFLVSSIILGTSIVEGIAFDVFAPSALIARVCIHSIAVGATGAWAFAVLVRDLRWMQRTGFEVHYTWIRGSILGSTPDITPSTQNTNTSMFHDMLAVDIDQMDELES